MLPRGSVSSWKRLFAVAENGPFASCIGPVRHKVMPPPKYRPDIVPLKLLEPDKPVSGSLEFEDMGKARKFEWDVASLNARGFLRFQKEYSPPKKAKETVVAISKMTIPQVNKLGDKELMEFELKDVKVKFEFLSKAFVEFDHSVPNSMLYLMNTVGDVVKFYSTPITTTTPYDELVRQKDSLPPNLHVQKEPIRFHPDTDTTFGGMTAFPKSSVIVTGIRAKKKYKGFEAKKSWP